MQLSQKNDGLRLLWGANRSLYFRFFVNYRQNERKNRAGGSGRGRNPIPPPGLRRAQAEATIKNMQEAYPVTTCASGKRPLRSYKPNFLGGKNDGMFLSHRR